jgi:heme/copper-type cytochrome/quinol oxidase subunit 3
MVMFIISEVLFFASIFWGVFHASLAPGFEVGLRWPSHTCIGFNPFGVPLFNTVLLLRSGVRVTWCHWGVVCGGFDERVVGLGVTVALGVWFTATQVMEYFRAGVGFSDGVFGSCFFISTGFHGCHVIVGGLFLRVVLMRMVFGGLRVGHHFGLEGASWY